MATGETFGNRLCSFSTIFLSNVTGSHDEDVFDCFSKEAGQILMSALLVLIIKSEAMKAFPHSHGLKVSRSWSQGLRVSSVAAQEEGTSSLLETYRGSKKVQPM